MLEVDFIADPEKRSKEWFVKERRKYTHRDWAREMGRDWTTAEGDAFFPEFAIHPAAYTATIGKLLPGPVVRGWDFGFRGPAPYSSDTEALTDKGWVLIKNIAVGDKVLTMRPDRRCEYQPVVRTLAKLHDGEMVHWKNKRNLGIDLRVTADHRVWLESRGELFSMEAGDAAQYQHPQWGAGQRRKDDTNWLPQAEPEPEESKAFIFSERTDTLGRKKEPKILSERAMAAFLGIYLSEGSLCRSKRPEGSTRHHIVWVWQKERDLEIEKILLATPFKWKWYKKGRHSGWNTSSAQLCEYLGQFGHARDKFVPRWIKESSGAVIGAFIRAYQKGDGRARDGSIVTASEGMADDLQELFLRVGVHATKTKDRETWCVAPHQHYRPNLSSSAPSVESVRGEAVYCVMAERNHIILVRRNGSPAWCGNCVWMQVSPKGRVAIIREILPFNTEVHEFRDLVRYLSGEVPLEYLKTHSRQRALHWVEQIRAKERFPFNKYPDPPWFKGVGKFFDFSGHEATATRSIQTVVSGGQGGEKRERNDAEVLAAGGINVNSGYLRRDEREFKVRRLLGAMDDGYAGLLVDPACALLQRAFRGALAYPKATPANPQPTDPARDGTYEHVWDAASYGVGNIVEITPSRDVKPLKEIWEGRKLVAEKREFDRMMNYNVIRNRDIWSGKF